MKIKIIRGTFVLLAVIATFATMHEACAQLYADPSSTGEWNSTRWSTVTNGPFTSSWPAGSNSIFLSGNNYTFGAATAGTFNVGNITVQSNATVQLTAQVTGSLGTGGNVRTITVETNAVLDFNFQTVSSSAGFIKEGSGVFALAGNSSYRNGFTLNEGTVVALERRALGAGTGTLTLYNGVIAANADQVITNRTGGAFITGDIQIGALSNNYAANAQYLINDDANISFMDDFSLDDGMRALTIGGNGFYTFRGVISDGGLTVDLAPGASGTMILRGDNIYTGGTVINSGTLQLGSNTVTGSVVGNITNNGTLAIYRSDDTYSLANLVSGSGSLVKLGTKTLSIVAENTYTGGTVISNGILSLGDGGTTGSVTGGIEIVSGTLQINRGDTFTMTNVISGGGRLFQAGAGTTILLGNNIYTGNTVISNSTLQVGNGGTSGTIAGTGINIGAGGSLVINRSDNVTLDQAITNDVTGSFVQLGSGTTTLTGVAGSVFKGGILVSNGTLQLGDGTQAFGLADGNITNNSTLIWNRSGNGNVSNVISGTGTFVKMGSGLLYMLADSTYTGGTIISNGILALGKGGTNATVVGDINIADAGAALRVMRDDTFTMTNQISGVGNFVQYGAGTLILTADNTYTGVTTISNGTLSLGNGGTSGSVAGDIVGRADTTLVINRSDNVAFGGVISSSSLSSLVKLGGGTATLTASSGNFAGTILISGGALQLGDGSAGSGRIGINAITNNSLLILNRGSGANNMSNLISGTGSSMRPRPP